MCNELAMELPISFSVPMATKVRRGDKTQTRRVVTAQNSLFDGGPCYRKQWSELRLDESWVDGGPSPAGNAGPYLKTPRMAVWEDGSEDRLVHRIYPRYQPGVKLWVREEWWTLADYDHLAPSKLPPDAPVWYQREFLNTDIRRAVEWGRTRRSIHLPRAFAGMHLQVDECRPERIQDISEEDCQAEGVDPGRGPIHTPLVGNKNGYWHAFRALWDEINASRGYGWDVNSWVWVITFSLRRAIGRTA